MAVDPLGLGIAGLDPSDPFGERASTGLFEPAELQPITRSPVLSVGSGGSGDVNISTVAPEQSSVTVKSRSGPTRAAEAEANRTLAELQANRTALAEVSGQVAEQARVLTQEAREAEIGANNAASQGFAEAESGYQKRVAEIQAESKKTHDETLKQIQEAGKHPFADKSLVFKIGVALLSGSNSYNNYVMGLDPSKSPFALGLRAILDKEEATQVAKIKAGQEYGKLQAEQGQKAADNWLQNRRATVKDQLAAAISAAQAKTAGAQGAAEAGALVQVPVIGPDAKPVIGPDGSPIMEAVPYAVAKERVAAGEKARLAQDAQLDYLAGYDPVSKIVEKPLGTPGQGLGPVSTDGKPLTSNSIVGTKGEYVGEAPTGKPGQTSELAQKVQSGYGTLERLRDWRGRMGEFIKRNGHTLNAYKPETRNEFNSLVTEGGGILTQSNQTGVLNDAEFKRYKGQIGGNSLWATPEGVQKGLDAIVRAGEGNQAANVKSVFPTYQSRESGSGVSIQQLQALKQSLEADTHPTIRGDNRKRQLERVNAELAKLGAK